MGRVLNQIWFPSACWHSLWSSLKMFNEKKPGVERGKGPSGLDSFGLLDNCNGQPAAPVTTTSRWSTSVSQVAQPFHVEVTEGFSTLTPRGWVAVLPMRNSWSDSGLECGSHFACVLNLSGIHRPRIWLMWRKIPFLLVAEGIFSEFIWGSQQDCCWSFTCFGACKKE